MGFGGVQVEEGSAAAHGFCGEILEKPCRLRGCSAAGGAGAAIERFKDGEGRTITFDVKATNVDTAWYAQLLSDATHRDEIRSVVVRIVRPDRLVHNCGPGASGCYSYRRGRGRIVVPAGAGVGCRLRSVRGTPA